MFRSVFKTSARAGSFTLSGNEERNMSDGGSFLVSAVGQIEKAHFPDFDDVYCKYAFVSGPDWEIVTVSVLGSSLFSYVVAFESATRPPGRKYTLFVCF